MIKNAITRGIVEGTNTTLTTMSEDLQEMVSVVVELGEVDNTCSLTELLSATMEIMLNMTQEGCMDEDDYLELCRECTYLLLDGDMTSLIA